MVRLADWSARQLGEYQVYLAWLDICQKQQQQETISK